MDPQGPLEGTCSCGRNHYLIYTSLPTSRHLQVIVNDHAANGHALSLRVPLSHLHSTTYAHFPDETHSTIRRVFSPYHAPHTKRYFCGFCGTPLSYWSEETPEEAEWISVNMSSLRNESLERLQDAGFLAAPDEEAEVDARETGGESREISQQSAAILEQSNAREVRGAPWYEEMVEGSELGRIKRRRGGQTTADGRAKYEWEILEIGGEEDESTVAGTAKRKLGMMGDGDDVAMRSG